MTVNRKKLTTIFGIFKTSLQIFARDILIMAGSRYKSQSLFVRQFYC